MVIRPHGIEFTAKGNCLRFLNNLIWSMQISLQTSKHSCLISSIFISTILFRKWITSRQFWIRPKHSEANYPLNRNEAITNRNVVKNGSRVNYWRMFCPTVQSKRGWIVWRCGYFAAFFVFKNCTHTKRICLKLVSTPSHSQKVETHSARRQRRN